MAGSVSKFTDSLLTTFVSKFKVATRVTDGHFDPHQSLNSRHIPGALDQSCSFAEMVLKASNIACRCMCSRHEDVHY